ncbi:acyclic terpene utilization AtuA family protein [Aurantimonas aggregata]|uniref:Acyclic terpene utilization AtuA family protein n=1 Tax=Aurantimonas aggregata TaxID=2047720 RepID=A0A6L9MNQ5_9HYPH|nr:acyclic terpene utilization AtuA family protein [Aurantimonas aggregata]NDV89443.1 acyclic terpene utilization AtuA family protein [Aurantimonas aggregata]
MAERVFRVGCGAGFGGDRLDAAISVVAALVASGEPACLMFETLAERTLALAQRERGAGRIGYDAHLIDRLAPVLAACLDNRISIVGNFGAADPLGAAAAICDLASRLRCRVPRIAVVTGDDLMSGSRPEGLAALLASGVPEGEGVISANVYLGAREIAAAVREGADIVVTGRVADPALAVGPIAAHFGWNFDDPAQLDRLASATMAGHLLECGAQVTGGYFCDPGFKDVDGQDRIGFPICEIGPDGALVVTKAPGTGGCVTVQTVKEQLLYEIHDPRAYLTPDVVLDLGEVDVREIAPDRVLVSGARGRPRPETLKATVCYEGGFIGEGEISYAGPNALARARAAMDTVKRRVDPELKIRADLIGSVSLFAGDDGSHMAQTPLPDSADVRLRIAVASKDRKLVEAAVYEVGALYTCGPAGGGGVRTGVRSRVSTGSVLVPRSFIAAGHHFYEAA